MKDLRELSKLEIEISRRSATKIEDVQPGETFCLDGKAYIRIRDVSPEGKRALLLMELHPVTHQVGETEEREHLPFEIVLIPPGTFVILALGSTLKLEL